MNRKRKCGDVDVFEPENVYGIVSTGDTWAPYVTRMAPPKYKTKHLYTLICLRLENTMILYKKSCVRELGNCSAVS